MVPWIFTAAPGVVILVVEASDVGMLFSCLVVPTQGSFDCRYVALVIADTGLF